MLLRISLCFLGVNMTCSFLTFCERNLQPHGLTLLSRSPIQASLDLPTPMHLVIPRAMHCAGELSPSRNYDLHCLHPSIVIIVCTVANSPFLIGAGNVLPVKAGESSAGRSLQRPARQSCVLPDEAGVHREVAASHPGYHFPGLPHPCL